MKITSALASTTTLNFLLLPYNMPTTSTYFHSVSIPGHRPPFRPPFPQNFCVKGSNVSKYLSSFKIPFFSNYVSKVTYLTGTTNPLNLHIISFILRMERYLFLTHEHIFFILKRGLLIVYSFFLELYSF